METIEVGDTVNYHAIVGGEITSTDHVVTHIGKIPSMGDEPVATVTGKSGCIAMDALSLKSKLAKNSATLGVVMNSIKIANIHDTIKPTGLLGSHKPGAMVAVRPCAEKYQNKTFLGMYLCSAPTSVFGVENDGVVVIRMAEHTNPAIYIPELDEIVWGAGSWWGEIESEKQLKDITDEDINNQWYVRALKQLTDGKEDEDGNS